MGKRSNFKRIARDFYPTPRKAVQPLAEHVLHLSKFYEPCAGDGALIGHLSNLAGLTCTGASDTDPRSNEIAWLDARLLEERDLKGASLIITNPPWTGPGTRGEPVLGMIHRFATLRPTWLLLPADFAHNLYFRDVANMCVKIVSVGRVRWIPGSKNTGVDNAAWYNFDAGFQGRTTFWGRQ